MPEQAINLSPETDIDSDINWLPQMLINGLRRATEVIKNAGLNSYRSLVEPEPLITPVIDLDIRTLREHGL